MTTLLRVTDERHERIVTWIGLAFVVVVITAVTIVVTVLDQSGSAGKDKLSIAIETPYVGQGVDDGTPVMLHGVKVGEVNEVSKLTGSRIRLDVELMPAAINGLTDAVGIDFRPSNHFGVTGINLTPADHGQILRNGDQISVTPKGNFTLQAMLYRLGELSHQVITPQLVSVFDRTTRYTDALNPLFETMIRVSTTVADVQKVSTEQLIRNAAAISVGLPPMMESAIRTGDQFLTTDIGTGFDPAKNRGENPYISYYDGLMMEHYDASSHGLATDPDGWVHGRLTEWLDAVGDSVFGAIGNLLTSHQYDLFPVIGEVRMLMSTVPRLLKPEDLAAKMHELRTRLEHMYEGSGEQRALQVRIVLDALPGIATPLGLALGQVQ